MRPGFLKKGRHSVGVARQYSGTAGRVENCQVGVFAAYASRWGHALIDRQLYLPKDWAEDAARRDRAFVPPDVAFATKPELAREMIARTLGAGLPCAWVLADAIYGSDFQLRRLLEDRGQPYVLAVRSNQPVRFLDGWMPVQTDPAAVAAAMMDEDWRTLSAGEGTKGPRLYHWARVPLTWDTEEGFERWLLIRRSRHDPEAWPTTSPTPPRAPRWPSSRARPGCAGPSSRPSRGPRTISGSTTARRAPGTAGTAT
jgi:hypothetical protein